jgi:hypothetical protein
MTDIIEEAEAKLDALEAELAERIEMAAAGFADLYETGGGAALKDFLARDTSQQVTPESYLQIAEILVARGLPRPAAIIRKAIETAEGNIR